MPSRISQRTKLPIARGFVYGITPPRSDRRQGLLSIKGILQATNPWSIGGYKKKGEEGGGGREYRIYRYTPKIDQNNTNGSPCIQRCGKHIFDREEKPTLSCSKKIIMNDQPLTVIFRPIRKMSSSDHILKYKTNNSPGNVVDSCRWGNLTHTGKD